MTGTNSSNDRLILRQNVEINSNEYFSCDVIFREWNRRPLGLETSLGNHQESSEIFQIPIIRASKTFVLCTEAETGYFGGRQAVKGEESQYSLTEALCLFWVPPWGLHLSPVTNIHIIDRVLYCRMPFLSPIIENWLWKWYRGIEKNTFQTNFIFFFQAFSTYFVHLFYNMYEMYEISYVEIMIMPRVRRRPILFWKK